MNYVDYAVIKFTDIFPGRALLGIHGANVYIFGSLADKAIGTLN